MRENAPANTNHRRSNAGGIPKRHYVSQVRLDAPYTRWGVVGTFKASSVQLMWGPARSVGRIGWPSRTAGNGSGRYSCAVAACARSSGRSLGAGLLSPEGGCRAWHSFAVRGLLDPVTAPGCALGGRTGSDPGGAAEAVPHKRLAMLVRGASHPAARVFRSLAGPVAACWRRR